MNQIDRILNTGLTRRDFIGLSAATAAAMVLADRCKNDTQDVHFLFPDRYELSVEEYVQQYDRLFEFGLKSSKLSSEGPETLNDGNTLDGAIAFTGDGGTLYVLKRLRIRSELTPKGKINFDPHITVRIAEFKLPGEMVYPSFSYEQKDFEDPTFVNFTYTGSVEKGFESNRSLGKPTSYDLYNFAMELTGAFNQEFRR